MRKKGEGISAQRVKGLKTTTLQKYQARVQYFLSKNPSMKLCDIGNWDETMFDQNKALLSGQYVGPPSGGHHFLTPDERSPHITVVVGQIGGWRMPLLIIFSGTEVNSLFMEPFEFYFDFNATHAYR